MHVLHLYVYRYLILLIYRTVYASHFCLQVVAFEKMIGAPVEEMLRTMGVDKLSKQQLQALGPDAAELVDMLRQLAAVKKR